MVRRREEKDTGNLDSVREGSRRMCDSVVRQVDGQVDKVVLVKIESRKGDLIL